MEKRASSPVIHRCVYLLNIYNLGACTAMKWRTSLSLGVRYLYLNSQSNNHSSKHYVQICKTLQLLGDFVPIPPTGDLPLDPTGELPSPETLDWPVFILGLSGGIPQEIFFRIPPPHKKKFYETEEPGERILTGTNFGPDLPLLIKLHEICSVDSQKNSLKLLPPDVRF